jgi:hypothetical protein
MGAAVSADYELRTQAGALLATSPDKAIALAKAEELKESFDRVVVERVVVVERRTLVGEFLSERAKAEAERAA